MKFTDLDSDRQCSLAALLKAVEIASRELAARSDKPAATWNVALILAARNEARLLSAIDRTEIIAQLDLAEEEQTFH